MGKIICILIPVVIGFVSAFFSMNTGQVYKELQQPWFAPPGWIFGPVWTVLYIMMGLASYLVWTQIDTNTNVKSALVFYGVQLIFNFFWTIIFFRLELRGIAFGEILILLALIIITTSKFYGIDKNAAYLMIPYILWVSFASILNFSIWSLNK